MKSNNIREKIIKKRMWKKSLYKLSAEEKGKKTNLEEIAIEIYNQKYFLLSVRD